MKILNTTFRYGLFLLENALSKFLAVDKQHTLSSETTSQVCIFSNQKVYALYTVYKTGFSP